jgi:uncharacterized protein YndB with AHSA1/START domain
MLKITVSAAIHAPIEKVWECWTLPGHITKWNFASGDWHCPTAANDLRIGGKYAARMEAKDGSAGFNFEAVYSKVLPQKELAYTMEDGRQASTIFETNGAGTLIKTTFDAETENPVEMQEQGWQMILNNFKKYVENEKTN